MTATSWRNVLKVHPAAELFPRMSPAELRELGQDIKKNGLQQPVAIIEQRQRRPDGSLHVGDPPLPVVLDGCSRLDAIENTMGHVVRISLNRKGGWVIDAGAKWVNDNVVVVDHDEVDPYAYVISANIRRRHLSSEDKDRLITQLLKADPTKSNRQVAKLVDASHPHVAKVRKQAEKAGDVETVTTSIDTKGRKQPAKKPTAAKTEYRIGPDSLGEADELHRPNGARAIMASRREPDDSLDYFPTPPWATRALIERVLPVLGIQPRDLADMDAWEPACGEGHMAAPLAEYFRRVIATDVHDYGYGEALVDFLLETTRDAHWCITNPPFGDKTVKFVVKALSVARVGVAMFVRLQWLESIERYELLFRDRPPTLVAFFVERVPLCEDRWDPGGSTATAYCWLVWMRGAAPQPPFWIPPGCREQLTRPDDVARFTTHPVTRKVVPPPGEWPELPAILRRRAPSPTQD
jgi:DNA-binding Lrp family transcriptional regulator